MKNTYLFFLILLSTVSFAQSYAILNSADGELMTFKPIYDKESLYGYVEVRKMNIDEQRNVTFKYIVLDVNFNKLCSGDLVEKQSPKATKRDLNDISFNNGYLRFDFTERVYALGSYQYSAQNIDYFFKTYQVVDIKENVIVSKGVYNTEVQDFTFKNRKKDNYVYTTYDLQNTGFLIEKDDFYDLGKPNEKDTYYAVNYKNEKIWEYNSTRSFKKYILNYSVFSTSEKYIVLKGYFSKGSKKADIHFLILDAKTGKELLYLPQTSKYTITSEYIYLLDEKLYTGGCYYKKDKKEQYNSDESLGIYQTVIDLTKKEVIQDKYVAYSEFPNLKINKYGKVRGEGYLNFQKRGINPDGTFLILAESYWQKKTYRAYTNLYTFSLDKDFNPTKTVEYDVKRTRGYKYDFTQTLPNKTGRAYFFFDKNDDKDLELNILNYYYKSKKEVIQKIPITNDDSVISVFPAKTGYVAIAEYFKKPKKSGKHMEIRLEKLNYDRE